MRDNKKDKEITYKQLAHVGVLAQYPTGWTKEINIISWNGGAAKFDVRDWDASHEHMSRGVTMTGDEMKRLIEAVKARDAVEFISDYNRASRTDGMDRYGVMM